MKKIKKIEDFSNKDWEAMASVLSGELSENSDNSYLSFSEDKYKTEDYWKELKKMKENQKINVDKAWGNLYSKIIEEGQVKKDFIHVRQYSIYNIIKIAAIIIMAIGLGLTALYLNKTDTLSKKIIAETDAAHKKIEVLLPDGSKVILNHNTRLVYPKSFEKGNRMVELTGEALFDITPDVAKPFIIDAGKAMVEVVGTTFNVITNNDNNAVEVFVKSGKVILTDSLGQQNITLEPGFLGVMDSQTTEKHINNDRNYLSWNTNILVYDGQKLEVVFNDLKKVYNIDIVANPEILNNTFRTTFDNETEETIITLICTAFNLDFQKDGNNYYLSEK
jgi:transmembrane sensor